MGVWSAELPDLAHPPDCEFYTRVAPWLQWTTSCTCSTGPRVCRTLGVAGVYTHDTAATKVQATTEAAEQQDFPLLVTMEPDSEEKND